MPEKHLVKDDSQGPDISFIGVNLSFENLWCHVDWWAEHGFSHLISRVEIFTEAEVSELDDSVIEENIIRLEIPVQNVVLIKYLESF